MPTSAVIHIQNSAPGPPRKTAVATPAMLPVPMVADSAVISALNGVIWPSPVAFAALEQQAEAGAELQIGMNFRPTCRKKPTPRIRTSISGPQTMPLMASDKIC